MCELGSFEVSMCENVSCANIGTKPNLLVEVDTDERFIGRIFIRKVIDA